MKHRLLVFGGRTDCGREFVERNLMELAAKLERPIGLLIQGGAAGVDDFARSWAMSNGIPTCTFEANWKFHGKPAGPIRNATMLEFGQPTLAVAFPGGRGTANMWSRVEGAAIPRIRIDKSGHGPIFADNADLMLSRANAQVQ